MPQEYREPLGAKKSAKEAWEALKALHIGSEKKAKGQQLRREYDNLKFRNGEAVQDFSL